MNAREEEDLFFERAENQGRDFNEDGNYGESVYEQYTDSRMFSHHNKLEETKMQQNVKAGYGPIGT